MTIYEVYPSCDTGVVVRDPKDGAHYLCQGISSEYRPRSNEHPEVKKPNNGAHARNDSVVDLHGD